MTLWRRIAAEKRLLIIPLACAIVANIALYVLIVHPKAVKSATMSLKTTSSQPMRSILLTASTMWGMPSRLAMKA